MCPLLPREILNPNWGSALERSIGSALPSVFTATLTTRLPISREVSRRPPRIRFRPVSSVMSGLLAELFKLDIDAEISAIAC